MHTEIPPLYGPWAKGCTHKSYNNLEYRGSIEGCHGPRFITPPMPLLSLKSMIYMHAPYGPKTIECMHKGFLHAPYGPMAIGWTPRNSNKKVKF